MLDSLFSYPKKYRLRVKQDFQSVFARSHKLTHNHLIVLYKSNQLPHPRLGIIIAKRYVKTAVMRNQLRRIVRESFRHHKAALKGLDLIVRVRSEWPLPSVLEDKKALRDDIDHLWQILAKLSAS